MVDFQRANSFDAVIEQVCEGTSGTLFEYEHLAFQNFQSYIEFRLEREERFFDSWYARVGESSDFLDLVGLFATEWDESGFKSAFEDCDDVSYLDALKFARDVMKYRRNEIIEEGIKNAEADTRGAYVKVSDEDVLSSIASMYNFPGESDAEAKEIVRDGLEELQEDLDSFQSILEADLQGSEDVVVERNPFSEMSIAEFVGAILSEEVEIIENEIAEYGFEPRIGDVEIGDVFVYGSPYVESAIEGFDGSDQSARVFQTVLQVTDVFTVERNGAEVQNFEYEIVKMDDRLLKAYPGHFVAGEEMPLGPSHQDQLYCPVGDWEQVATDVAVEDSEYGSF